MVTPTLSVLGSVVYQEFPEFFIGKFLIGRLTLESSVLASPWNSDRVSEFSFDLSKERGLLAPSNHPPHKKHR